MFAIETFLLDTVPQPEHVYGMAIVIIFKRMSIEINRSRAN